MKNLLKLVLVSTLIITWFACNKKEDWSDIPQSKVVESKKIELSNDGFKKLPAFEPGVVLVKFRDNKNQRALNKTLVTEFNHRHTIAMKSKGDNGFYKVTIRPGKEDSVIGSLKNNPDVVYAEKNWAVYTQTIPDDPYYNPEDLWGSFAINQQAALAHGNYGSRSVIVGVIDEPIFNCHEDLSIWNNPYDQIDGIDNDGNGYIDDLNGWNFAYGGNAIYSGPYFTHGTHVSGTIGAKGGNQKGVIGVSPYVTIIAAPFLGLGGGYIDNAVLATDYLTGLKLLHPDLKISHSSNSWGGSGYSQSMKDAIDRAANADIGFIAAAGNSALDNDVSDFYPANYIKVCPNVMAIGASDWSNERAYFSDIGKTTVSLFAPGTGIKSTVPTKTNESGYADKSGTSMATPQVSGAAALLRAAHPEWSFLRIKDSLIKSVTKITSLTDLCVAGGILNLNNQMFFVSTPEVQPEEQCHGWPIDVTPPSRPMNFRLYGGLNEWPGYGVNAEGGYFFVTADVPPPSDGVVAYTIMLDGPWWQWGTFLPSGLTGAPIRAYDIYCYAYDVFGNLSDSSNHIRFTLVDSTPPDTQAPTIPNELNTSNITESSIRLNWGASTDNVGVTGYKINWRASGGTWLETTVTGTSNTFNSLSQNTSYEFNVQARDAAGNWSANSSTVSATTLTPPPTYTITSNLNGSAQGLNVNLNWSISTTGIIQSVKLEKKKGGNPFTEIATVTNQTSYQDQVSNPGQYSYRIKVTLTNSQVGYSNKKTIQAKKK